MVPIRAITIKESPLRSHVVPDSLIAARSTRVAPSQLLWVFEKGSFVLQRRDNHLRSQHPDVSSGRLRNLFDTGSHRPGTANAGVRGRQERTWSRVPHVSRGRSEATRCFVVGHYILRDAARKKLLFRTNRNRLLPSIFCEHALTAKGFAHCCRPQQKASFDAPRFNVESFALPLWRDHGRSTGRDINAKFQTGKFNLEIIRKTNTSNNSSYFIAIVRTFSNISYFPWTFRNFLSQES